MSIERTRRCFGAEILELEIVVAKLARVLARMQAGFEELSNIDTTPLAVGPDFDDEVA
jgi:hypothetical protein